MASSILRFSAGAPGLAVQPSGIAGKGLFTRVPRREGERICVIQGEVISVEEAIRRDSIGNTWIYELGEDTCLDTSTTLARFVNHACEPSCIVMGRDESSLYLIAARDLRAGEELTIDYDFAEIFDACRRDNPECLRDACPRARESRTAS